MGSTWTRGEISLMNPRQNTPMIKPNRVRKYPGRMPPSAPGGANYLSPREAARPYGPSHNELEQLDSATQKQTMDYLGWLNAQAVSVHSPEKIQAYREVALATRKVGKREVRTFAPFQQQSSALQVITPAQIRFLIIIVLCWNIGLFFLHSLMFTLTLGVITTLYVGGFLLSVILATHA